MHTSFRGLVMPETAILELYKLYIFSLILVFTSCNELTEFETRQVDQALGKIDTLFNSTESWNLDMNMIEENTIRLNLRGSYSYNIRKEDETETRISGPVFIDIFDENGVLESHVYCDSAVYRPDDELFEMYHNVVVKTEGGRELRSDFLLWERKKDMVSTSEFVIFISPPDSIAANGFYGNSNLTNYTLNEGGGQVVIE